MASRFGTYGTPGDGHLDSNGLYAQSLHELHARCSFEYAPIHKVFPSFIMNHFRDNEAYDAFRGTDYTPHNLHKYPEHSHWRHGLKPRPPGAPPVVGGLCDLPSTSGSTAGQRYTIMRAGPFTSNGGYDWWQFAGHDVLNMSRHMAGGETIGILSHWVTAVDAASGYPLGYPPMHVHHIHLVPQKPWLRYQWATPSTASWRNVLSHLTQEQGAAYYVPNYVAEQHGEWDLCDITATADGRCFAESLPAGHTNLLDFSLDFEGELNDGRAVGAANLTWWLEIGLGWTRDVAPLKPLSYAVITEDHFGMVNGHQHTYENYHWVPSEGEWVNYYTVSRGTGAAPACHHHPPSQRHRICPPSPAAAAPDLPLLTTVSHMAPRPMQGRMPTGGELVRMKHHVHMNLLERAYFLSASAAELDLSARPLGPNGREMGKKEIPGAFFSHGGRLGKLFESMSDDDVGTAENLHTWPVGVVTPQALGAKDLDALEVRDDNLSPSLSTCPHMPPHATTCRHMPPHVPTCPHMSPHVPTCHHMPPHATTCHRMQFRTCSCCYIPPHAATCHHTPPHAATRRHVPLHAVICRYMLLHGV